MAAFVAKQMVGNKLSAVKGEFRKFFIMMQFMQQCSCCSIEMISSIFLGSICKKLSVSGSEGEAQLPQ